MLNILGSFKVLADLELLSEEEWTVDSNLLVDTSYIKSVFNCFDESALEMMLKLSDLSEGFNVITKLNALTIGNSIADNYLKTLYALGFEQAVRIECDKNIMFQPELTAELITEYVSQKGGQNLIIMGSQSADAGNKKIPFLVAENLSWPCINQVTDVSPIDDEHIQVTCDTDDTTMTLNVMLPCILAVGNTANSYLRVPTLKQRMQSKKKQIEKYEIEELYSDDEQRNIEQQKLIGMKVIDNQRAGLVLQGDSIEEKVQKLYEDFLKERWF